MSCSEQRDSRIQQQMKLGKKYNSIKLSGIHGLKIAHLVSGVKEKALKLPFSHRMPFPKSMSPK